MTDRDMTDSNDTTNLLRIWHSQRRAWTTINIGKKIRIMAMKQFNRFRFRFRCFIQHKHV